MFIFTNLFLAMAKVIDLAVTLYIFVIIARVILSWINYNPHSSVIQFVYNITEPVLVKIRHFIPIVGGIDFSPMILIFVLWILQGFVVQTLRDLAMALK